MPVKYSAVIKAKHTYSAVVNRERPSTALVPTALEISNTTSQVHMAAINGKIPRWIFAGEHKIHVFSIYPFWEVDLFRVSAIFLHCQLVVSFGSGEMGLK